MATPRPPHDLSELSPLVPHHTGLTSGQGNVVLVFAVSGCFLLALTYLIGPLELLHSILDVTVTHDPTWQHALGWSGILATLMVLPIPIIFLVLLVPGLLFGFWKGYCIIAAGLFVGSSCAFAVGRLALRDPIHFWLEKERYDKILFALKVLEHDQDSILLLVTFRFLTIPFFARNYSPVILSVPLWKLVLTAVPHHLWVAFVFGSLGSVFKDTREMVRKSSSWDWHEWHWQHVAPAVVGMVGSAIVAWLSWRMYDRAAADYDEHHKHAPRRAAPV